jgi:acetyl esterase/lipase
MHLRFLLLLLPLSFATAAPERLPLWPQGAPYAKGQTDDDQPRLEIYRPAKERANGTAVVICPGGGYGGLAADHEGTQPALYFNNLGVTAYVLFYRLGSHGYRHPVELGDAQRALRVVRSRAAQDGIDAGRIGIMGFSAGGHLAASAGTHFDAGNAAAPDPVDRLGCRPDWMVLCYPVASFDPAITHKGSVNNLLGEKANDPELIKLLSNELQVTPNTPPGFLFHTTEDQAVPVENSLRMYEALKKNKVACELHVYQNGVHGVGLVAGDPVLGTWPGHLTAWLRDSGFLTAKVERAAVEGTVTVNGRPASWATLCFTPDDPNQPVVTARVRNGKYSLPAADGPVKGAVKITATLSAADVPGSKSVTGFLTTTEKVRGKGEALKATVNAGKNSVNLDLTWAE